MGLHRSISFHFYINVQSKDSVTALIFDKYTFVVVFIHRMNLEFVLVKQFRPSLLFGASELSKKTVKNPNMGYWYVDRIYVIT